MVKNTIKNEEIVLPLKITGKWELIIFMWVLLIPLFIIGLWLYFFKTTNLNTLGMPLILLIMCIGIYLYQKCHVIILTQNILAYRGLGHFGGWLKINLADIENDIIDIGYGTELKRTGIVARWYLLDKNNKELGVINFGAFADKDIGKVFQCIRNKKNLIGEKNDTKESNNIIQKEIKKSTKIFYKNLLKMSLYLLAIFAIATIFRVWFI